MERNEFEVGLKVYVIDDVYGAYHMNGFTMEKDDILEVVSIDKTTDYLGGILKNVRTKKERTWNFAFGYHYFKIYQPPKPHEYSPVQMTGRYRTIGD